MMMLRRCSAAGPLVSIIPRVALRSVSLLARRWLSSRGPVMTAYESQINAGVILRDANQVDLAQNLDALYHSLASTDSLVLTGKQLTVDHAVEISRSSSFSSSFSKAVAFAKHSFRKKLTNHLHGSSLPRGIYIHGSVGVGKSFLMDIFYNVSQDATRQRKRKRAHFHEFMLDVHQRIHDFKQIHPKEDPIPPVALALAREAQLLCFDEFQVTDIADAMIMKRLFTLLFDLDVVVVSTSNRPPAALYEGGLNRSLFLPFVDILKEACHVVEIYAIHDYRRDTVVPDIPYSYFWPAKNPNTRASLDTIFDADNSGRTKSEVVPVRMGRNVYVSRANEKCGWFDFRELCFQPLGAADYISLGERFPIIIVDGVPQLGANHYNEARRFITLIDALYESKTRLVIAADVPLKHLFVDFEAKVETNLGDEETAVEDAPGMSLLVKEKAIQNQRGDEESWLNGEGGSSSSSSTTMIRTREGDMEWSATGRIGVSLAQLSGVKDVVFSFRRAESRLAEMSGAQWGR